LVEHYKVKINKFQRIIYNVQRYGSYLLLGCRYLLKY